MKIDKVEAIKVDVPLDKSFGGGTYNVDRRTAIITKIYTDDGVISEVFAGDDRYKSDIIVKSINEILGPDIIGSDPNELETIWNLLFMKHVKNAATDNRPILKNTLIRAIACIDFAIWDIIGKSKKKSVVDLLGKKKEKLKVSTIGGYYVGDE